MEPHQSDHLNQAAQSVPAQWNECSSDYPRDKSIHVLFEEHAAAAPNAPALISHDNAVVTYGELNERANRLAHRLRASGVGPDSLVGIYFERGANMVAAMLAILKAGGAYVPFDPRYPAERLSLMIADTGVTTILSDRDSAAKFRHDRAGLFLIDSDSGALADERVDNLPDAATSRNLAYVIYTSGSTGRPKGVMVEHRSVVRVVRNTNYVAFDASDRILQLAPLSFDASVFEIWGAILNGASLVIMPPGVPSIDSIREVVSRNRVTAAFFTPALFNMIVDSGFAGLESLSQVVVGGDTLSARHMRRALIEGPPKCAFINGYGPTETTVFAACFRITSEAAQQARIPIGYPIANTSIYILNSRLEPTQIGEIGEVHIGGDGLARGYLNSPELTAEKFVRARWNSAQRLYRTGDLGFFRPDGAIEFVGRADTQIKVSGYRIEPGEIEFALREHPQVRDAIALCDQSEQENKRLVAYCAGDSTLSASELRGFLAARLPFYMIPEALIILDSMPLTPNGKIDRAALPRPHHAGALGDHIRRSTASPQTRAHDAEEAVAAIWRKVLGRDEIGSDENFFDAGGDSLKLIAVHSELRRNLNATISMPDLFEHPTIGAIARRLGRTDAPVGDRGDLDDRARKRNEMLKRQRAARTEV